MCSMFLYNLEIFLAAGGTVSQNECTDGSNENGTLTNKYYWNEGSLKGDNM